MVAACAVSPDAGPKSARYPSRVPPNLRFADLSMEELRDLYCEASLVVIPMLRNPLGAGGTVAGEARACGTPLIVSHTSYLSGLAEKGLAVGVAPGDPADLRRAIVAMLDDAPGRAELAQRSRRALLDINATPAVLATWHRYLRATFGVADVGATRPRAEVSGTG